MVMRRKAKRSHGPLSLGLDKFLRTSDLMELFAVLLEHPELLSDEADAVLRGRITDARTIGGDYTVVFLDERRRLLARCREVGMDQAFGEKTTDHVEAFIKAKTLVESQNLVEAHPELLSGGIDGILSEHVTDARTADNPALATFLEERRRLLARCREVGVRQAFAERGA